MSINIGDLQNNIYHELLDILQKENNLLITGHIDPDGDCIGSMLAIYHGFNGQAKGWQMVIECPVPEHLLFYPGAEMIKTVGEVEKELSSFSSALLLDCNQVFRAGSWLGKLWDDFSNRLIIDHHQGVGDDADLSLIEKDAAATGLIIAVLLQKAGLNIDQDIATCLYGSIAADTGCFRYSNTTAQTLVLAGELLSKGVNLEAIRINLFENRSPVNMKMVSVAFNSLQYRCDGRLCSMALDKKSKIMHQADDEDCRNIVSFTLNTQGVEVGIFFDECDDFVRISFRCRNSYAVDVLANYFGGGGHIFASGCRIQGTLQEIYPLVMAKAEELFA